MSLAWKTLGLAVLLHLVLSIKWAPFLFGQIVYGIPWLTWADVMGAVVAILIYWVILYLVARFISGRRARS